MVFLATECWELPTKDLLSWIFDEPSYDQDRPVYINADDPKESLSLRESRTIVRQLAAGLHHAGLQRGDCVSVHSFNNIYYPVLFLGIIAAGGVFAGSNPAYTHHELVHHITTARVKFLISEPDVLDHLKSAAAGCKIPSENMWLLPSNPGQSSHSGLKSWRELLEYGERDWLRFGDLETCKNTPAARLFSSGTTGLPKATNVTHYNLVAQHELVYEGLNKRPYDVIQLFPLPFFHAATAPRTHTSAIKAGWKVYVMRRFELESFLMYFEKYQVNDILCVPPMLMTIINSPLSNKYSLKSCKAGISGAAPVGSGPQARLQALMADDAAFTQVWGMTESSCTVSMIRYPERDDTASVGRPIPNTDIKIVDDQGEDITRYGVVGELCVRGPTIVPGYFENPEANRSSFDADGFYHSGDIGYCDEKTNLWYIVDRKKELIKVRGFQVAPSEIEAVLLNHPDIVDAAVIGISNEHDDEVPRAYVVRRPGTDPSKLTQESVTDYASEKLAKYKRLSGGVKFVGSIPKNASGKILKRELRESVKQEVAVPGKL